MTAIVLPGIRRPMTNSVRTFSPRDEPATAWIIPIGKIDTNDMAKQRKTDQSGIENDVVLGLSEIFLQRY